MELVVWLMLGVFLLFIYYSNKKRKDAALKLEASVQVGAKVIMLGGIVGTVSAVNDKTLVVETSPGTKIEFVKAAVRSVEEPDVSEAKATAKKTATKKKPTE